VRLVGNLAFAALMLVSVRRTKWLLNRKRLPIARIDALASTPVSQDDFALCQRIIDAYQRVQETRNGKSADDGMWAWIFDSRQELLAETLARGDERILAELLAGMFDEDFVLGMAAGPLIRQTRSNRICSRAWEIKCLDGLASLAEVAGVVPVEALEQGHAGLAFKRGLPDLVASMESALGVPIGIAEVGAACGLKVGERLITPDTPDQIYAALRMSDAIDVHLRSEPSTLTIVEIGGGYGGMCSAFLNKHPDPRSYTIIDLPIVNAIQAYFLSKAIGADRVSLYGEQPRQVRVLPDFAIEELETPVDVVVNKDSLPEMPAKAMRRYLEWIGQECRGLFYSYNQETAMEFMGERQGIVHEAIHDLGSLRRIRRDRAWLREGYVEEIYVPSGSPLNLEPAG
jgi:hypothetical protein